MKAALVLSLAGSSVAVPFGNIFEAMFGNSHEARQITPPDFPPPFPSGTGVPFPTGTAPPFAPTGVVPTGTAPVPEGTGIYSILPAGPLPTPEAAKPPVRRLRIDYNLAPRQDLPSFSLANPSDTPAASEPAFPFPTGEQPPFPTGEQPPFPTGGFPGDGQPPFPTGTGAPSFPTTLQTLTRGPQPTGAPEQPEFPGDDQPDSPGWWDSWQEWLDSWKQGRGN